MKSQCFFDYQEEREKLSQIGIDQILETGRAWNLASCLSQGGVVVFPHTYLHVCGRQIAAAVHAALDSGADQVLALGVLHSLSEEMINARAKEREREDLSHCQLRGIHGPTLTRSNRWQAEYSLLSFLFLWEEEIKRRNIHPPKLIMRYPYLTNREPEKLPGIEELEAIARDSVIVATADFCHHGVAYGEPREKVLDLGPEALAFAGRNITTHMQILAENSYDDYYRHCLEIRSDAYDVASVIRHLRGSLDSRILDIILADASSLFEGNPHPSWVAASLIAMNSK